MERKGKGDRGGDYGKKEKKNGRGKRKKKKKSGRKEKRSTNLLPAVFVDRGIDLDDTGAHGLLSKALDLAEGAGGTLLEGDTEDGLGKVDGVVARDGNPLLRGLLVRLGGLAGSGLLDVLGGHGG